MSSCAIEGNAFSSRRSGVIWLYHILPSFPYGMILAISSWRISHGINCGFEWVLLFREVAVCNIWQPDALGSYFIQALPKIMVHSRGQITGRSHASLPQKQKNTVEHKRNQGGKAIRSRLTIRQRLQSFLKWSWLSYFLWKLNSWQCGPWWVPFHSMGWNITAI